MGEPAMRQVTIEIPAEALLSLHQSPQGVADEVRRAAAFKLYELGRLSSGAAAQLAGMSRTAFLSRLAEYGVVAFDPDEEDLKREARLGRTDLRRSS